MYTMLRYHNVSEALKHESQLAAVKIDALSKMSEPSNDYTIEETRNGPAFIYQDPLLFTYTNPRQRVLFNTARNANPFFHLIEALWMLAGRNTVDPLHHFCKQITAYSDDLQDSTDHPKPTGEYIDGVEQYDYPISSPGKATGDQHEPTFHGAYGYRWRQEFYSTGGGTWDQIHTIIKHLKEHPNSRRAVLTMWSPLLDLAKESRDLPCNMLVTFQIKTRSLKVSQIDWLPTYTDPHDPSAPKDSATGRPLNIRIQDDGTPLLLPDAIPRSVENGEVISPPVLEGVQRMAPHQRVQVKVLDMTVHNRSNDMVWGLFGANAVHFSMLQEYVAIALGLQVGYMHTVTDNLHVYKQHWDKLKAYSEDETPSAYNTNLNRPWYSPYTPMVPLYNSLHPHKDHMAFTHRCAAFVDWVSVIFNAPKDINLGELPDFYTEEHMFLQTVARPAMFAYWCHKRSRPKSAYYFAYMIAAADWRQAMLSWLNARSKDKWSPPKLSKKTIVVKDPKDAITPLSGDMLSDLRDMYDDGPTKVYRKDDASDHAKDTSPPGKPQG